MILGVGVDVVQIPRMESLVLTKENALSRVFTSSEIEDAKKYQGHEQKIAHFAKRFAAKEAFAKAVGVGIGKHIGLTDIEIKNTNTGQPIILISDKVNAFIQARFKVQDVHIHLSLSDDDPIAMAYVVLEAH